MNETLIKPAPWVYDDGGRAAAGYEGSAGDCVTRAIAIATGIPYFDVYHELYLRQANFYGTRGGRRFATTRGGNFRSPTPRNGVSRPVYQSYLSVYLGLKWTPTMGIGTGTTVHLREGELPMGRLIVRCSKHLVAVIDGVVHDTFDPTRDGTRAVYGYWTATT